MYIYIYIYMGHKKCYIIHLTWVFHSVRDDLIFFRSRFAESAPIADYQKNIWCCDGMVKICRDGNFSPCTDIRPSGTSQSKRRDFPDTLLLCMRARGGWRYRLWIKKSSYLGNIQSSSNEKRTLKHDWESYSSCSVDYLNILGSLFNHSVKYRQIWQQMDYVCIIRKHDQKP